MWATAGPLGIHEECFHLQKAGVRSALSCTFLIFPCRKQQCPPRRFTEYSSQLDDCCWHSVIFSEVGWRVACPVGLWNKSRVSFRIELSTNNFGHPGLQTWLCRTALCGVWWYVRPLMPISHYWQYGKKRPTKLLQSLLPCSKQHSRRWKVLSSRVSRLS